MDNSLMKKVTEYPANSPALGRIQSPNFTEGNVITADLSVFHDMPNADVEDAEMVVNEVIEPNYDDGLRDGKAQSDLVYLNTIGVMQKALDELQTKIRDVTADIEVRHLSAVAACLKAAMPSLVRSGTASEIQQLISQTVEMSLSADLTLKIHPDSAGGCKRLCELHGQNIEITTDPSLDIGHVQLLWENGGAEIKTEDVMQNFVQKLDGLLSRLETKNTTETE